MAGIENLNGSALKGSVENVTFDSLPGLLPKKTEKFDIKEYHVRYGKFNIGNDDEMGILERIETRALHGDGIVVLSKKDFVFMDQMFMMIQYLEKGLVRNAD